MIFSGRTGTQARALCSPISQLATVYRTSGSGSWVPEGASECGDRMKRGQSGLLVGSWTKTIGDRPFNLTVLGD